MALRKCLYVVYTSRGAGSTCTRARAVLANEATGLRVSLPELDIASQGATIEEARRNLQEALELFFVTADASEITSRLHDEIFVTRVGVAVG
ncbi:MAG: type II toxin-antitoxin system HicB family antitoxin [Rudaea sp.]